MLHGGKPWGFYVVITMLLRGFGLFLALAGLIGDASAQAPPVTPICNGLPCFTAANPGAVDATGTIPGFVSDVSVGTMICTTANGSAAVTGCNGTPGLAVGQILLGPGIVAGTTVAGGITATGFTMSAAAGVGAGAGLVSARGPFWSDVDSGTPQIMRLTGRLMVGNAVGTSAARFGTYFDFCPTSAECANWVPRDSSLSVMSPIGSIAISGMTRSSYASGIVGIAPIGLAGIMINDAAGITGWGGYLEIQHEAAATFNSYALELNSKNKGASTTKTPYTDAAGTFGLWLNSGGDPNYGGAAVNPSNAAVVILKSGLSTKAWNTGILFTKDSLTGADGISGQGTAIRMARNHIIRWDTSGGTRGLQILSDVATDDHGMSVIAQDDIVFVLGPGGFATAGFKHTPSTTTANHLSLWDAAAASSPHIDAEGSDTDISIIMTPKGAGTTTSTKPISGSALQISAANAISFPSFESGTAGDTIAIGRGALGGTAPSSAAYQSVAIGALSMSGNGITTAALKNTAVGYNSMAALTSGTNNTAVGNATLAGITSGSGNVAIGPSALVSYSTQNNSVAIGSSAMSLATGAQSVGIGASAAGNETGGSTTAVGYQAGQFVTSGAGQTAFGFSAMQGITGTRITGANNTAVGQQAGLLLQGAAATNVLVGSLAGSSITSGLSNVVIGPSVVSTTLTTGGNNVLIGTSSALDAAAFNSSNTIRIGTSSTAIIATTGAGTPTTAITTVAGNFVLPQLSTGTNADTVCMEAGGKLLIQAAACTISSLRFKRAVGEYKIGGSLETIAQLEPIVFRMKPGDLPNADINYDRPQIGLSAENVAAIEPRCAIYEDDGTTPKSYRQECLIAVLVAGMKAQQAEIETLKAR